MTSQITTISANIADSNFQIDDCTKYYIIPIKRYKAGFPINLEVIVPATNPKRAMYLAKEEFEKDGWIINEEYEKYKVYKSVENIYMKKELFKSLINEITLMQIGNNNGKYYIFTINGESIGITNKEFTMLRNMLLRNERTFTYTKEED